MKRIREKSEKQIFIVAMPDSQLLDAAGPCEMDFSEKT